MVHVPTAITVTVLPETEHTSGVLDVYVIPSPELAVAANVTGAGPV
jgi:hypothetical protein